MKKSIIVAIALVFLVTTLFAGGAKEKDGYIFGLLPVLSTLVVQLYKKGARK
jgi:hypothetical protein